MKRDWVCPPGTLQELSLLQHLCRDDELKTVHFYLICLVLCGWSNTWWWLKHSQTYFLHDRERLKRAWDPFIPWGIWMGLSRVHVSLCVWVTEWLLGEVWTAQPIYDIMDWFNLPTNLSPFMWIGNWSILTFDFGYSCWYICGSPMTRFPASELLPVLISKLRGLKGHMCWCSLFL